MFGNPPIQEPHFKLVARKTMRATFFGYGVFDMILLLFFISFFTLTIPKVNILEETEIERLYDIKKVIAKNDYVCINNSVYIEDTALENVYCRVLLTYVRFSYKGYYFYEDKRL